MDAVLVREEDDEKNNVGQQAEQEAKDENQERKTVKKEVAKRAMPIIKPIVKHQQPMITRGRKQKLPNVYVLIQPETPPITSPLNVV